MPRELSIYFHIPLCARKCPYCHFYTVPNKKAFREVLLEGLFWEWERVAPWVEKREVVSIYFGGGTPWLLGPEAVGSLLARIPRKRGCEITLEANPQEVTALGAAAFAAAGVNRLSIGVQSFDDVELKRLGRVHTANAARAALFAAKEGGIDNLSIDLMYDTPGQTLASWEWSLESLSDLPLSHLSLYNLTFEPGTVFFKRRKVLEPLVPGGEESTEMLQRATGRLEALGLKRYEISAFAGDGCASRHNLGYWMGREFLGLGPSAFSYVGGRRFRNAAHLNRYVRALKRGGSAADFEERLPFPRDVNELLAIGLRVLSGVDLEKVGEVPEETLRTLSKLEAQGYLLRRGSYVKLTEQGLLFYDTVASEIV